MNIREQEALFDAARRLGSGQARRAFLSQACVGNPLLLEQVEALLSAQDEADSFFDTAMPVSGDSLREAVNRDCPIPDANSAAEGILIEGPGSRIGRYKLLQEIGAGGCGVVYMAEQEAPVRRRVALKIIKLGMDTKSVIARFEAERQALAMMDHPNIARVLDAGATRAGRPYFVMELVRGVKLTEYCDQNKLDTRQRLALCVQVCQAIQHAHQKGIIHRDIKPSNILVTLHDGIPVPKVIDFGIAKATESRLTEKTLFTAYEQVVGTPAYMSPEQAEMSGLDIDTRSDIYSLGVLLYELLTGRTPFDPKKLIQNGIDGMRRTLRETEPFRPSMMLTTLQGDELTATALHRQVEAPKLISIMSGDLDWIVMKAMEKDRTRRYETANGLAMDLQRYLGNEPVFARPPTRIYRFQKLVRRNKGVFTAVSAVALALVLGLGASTYLFLMERDARRRAVDAERQQSRLRELAEVGRQKETQLRLQAETRQKMTQAAVFLGQNRISEADQLVAGSSPTQETLEGAAIFRMLGDWNALQGRWTAASDRFEMLLRIDQMELSDLATLDQTRCSCTLIEAGELERYEQCRQRVIRQFSATKDPIVAERVVKISLLAPADAPTMQSLSPLAQFAISSMSETNSLEDWVIPWRCVSLALWKYRNGQWEDAAAFCNQCLSYQKENPSRNATAHLILAMANARLERTEAARTELAQGLGLIDAKLDSGLDLGNGGEGFWYDWILAKILGREASLLIPVKSTASKSTTLSDQ